MNDLVNAVALAMVPYAKNIAIGFLMFLCMFGWAIIELIDRISCKKNDQL
jgi:hypothetical protein